MDGSNFNRCHRGIIAMARNPRDLIPWLKWMIFRHYPIDLGLPWISWPAIRELNKINFRGSRVLEWGAGGSTLYFLRRGAKVTTIETDSNWLELTRCKITSEGLNENWNYILLSDFDLIREYDRYYSVAKASGHKFDLILIDGPEDEKMTRVQCLPVAVELLNEGGIIILDDSWREIYQVSLLSLKTGNRTRYMGLGPCRIGVTTTDFIRT